jgi:hypothetical protein
LVIEPLPEQALGNRRARRSPRTFSWLSILAPVEVQLVLRCLDFRGRLLAARCNKQLYGAASHPFAWPQEQSMTLRADNDVASLQLLGDRVRGSLLRLVPIRLHLVQTMAHLSLCSEVCAVPHLQTIRVLPPAAAKCDSNAPDVLLPLLHHPAAHELRSLDVSCLWDSGCSSAELQRLQSFPHLHSISLHPSWESNTPAVLQHLSLFPSLTHLGLDLSVGDQFMTIAHIVVDQMRLYPSLPLCTRLVSLYLRGALVCPELLACLAQLPLLERLQLRGRRLERQTAVAWVALHSLRVLQLDGVDASNRLLFVLSSVPTLRLLRWRCRIPQFQPVVFLPSSLPSLKTLRKLMNADSVMHVQLVLPSTFAEWRRQSIHSVDHYLRDYQQREWDKLQRLPARLPRVRIVEVEPEDDE